MFNILIVEDDKNMRRLMSAVLKQNRYNPFGVENGEQALEMMGKEHIDLIISDIMMPKLDGYGLTKVLRTTNYTLPILLVTAKEDYNAKEQGFLAGADDYMVKPIDLNEMVLRVQALLRRSKIVSEHKLEIGDITLNYNAYTVSKGDKITTLPNKEFLLLYKLLSYPNTIFTRIQLMDEIWGMDAGTDERTVDVHIKRLRDRFRDVREFAIITVRGLGYKSERYV